MVVLYNDKMEALHYFTERPTAVTVSHTEILRFLQENGATIKVVKFLDE
jgi:hypothetical protein